MTLTKTITLEIKMFSECSEAHLSDHLEKVCQTIIHNVKQEKYHSWNNTVDTSWEDESFPVNIEIIARR